MAYDSNRIEGWMNQQPDPHEYADRETILLGERPAIVIDDSSSDDGTFVTDSSHNHLTWIQLVAVLQSKRLCPLNEEVENDGAMLHAAQAFERENHVGQRALQHVKNTHILDSRRIYDFDQAELLHVKTLFHVARTNYPTSAVIRSIIPTSINRLDPEFAYQSEQVMHLARDCYDSSFEFVSWAVTRIENAVDQAYGRGFFRGLNRFQTCFIFGAVFDQFPVRLMTRFKELESEVIDWRPIFAKGVNRRDRAVRERMAGFFRYGFVRFCYKMYLQKCGQVELVEIGESWKWLDKMGRVTRLKLGGAFDLPARRGSTFEKRR